MFGDGTRTMQPDTSHGLQAKCQTFVVYWVCVKQHLRFVLQAAQPLC